MTQSYRIALYARVSTTDKQDIDNQLLELRAYSQQSGYTMAQEYIDHISGETTDRPAFKKMMQAASEKKFDLLLFWSLDRFSREGATKTLKLLEQLTLWGIKYRSLKESYINTEMEAFQEVVIAIIATLAKQERLRISDRTKAGLARARAQGKKLGRPSTDPHIQKTIIQLRQTGASWSNIVHNLNIPRSTAQSIWKKHQARQK